MTQLDEVTGAYVQGIQDALRDIRNIIDREIAMHEADGADPSRNATQRAMSRVFAEVISNLKQKLAEK